MILARHNIIPEHYRNYNYGIGGGMVLRLRNLARQAAKYSYPNITPLMEGEEGHLPFANYCGPGTNLKTRLTRGDKGVTPSDNMCKIHDIDYDKVVEKRKGDITYCPAEDVRKADNKLEKGLEKTLKMPGKLNKMHAKMGLAGMRAKKLGEDLGILSPSRFVEPSKEEKKEEGKGPARLLKKEIEKQESKAMRESNKKKESRSKPKTKRTKAKPTIAKRKFSIKNKEKLISKFKKLPPDVKKKVIEKMESGEEASGILSGLLSNVIKGISNLLPI